MSRNIHTAVITGPTGAIGTALCDRLLLEGITVYAICRPGSSRVSVLPHHENLHLIFCDASSYSVLPTLVDSADAFFHLAWAHTIGSGRNDMPTQINNIRYTIDAVQAAKVLGCCVFVGAGSQAEYGRHEGVLSSTTPTFPETGYGMAKLCAGQMSRVECQHAGIDHIWTRVLSVYGPHDSPFTMISSTIRKLLAGTTPSLTAGVQLWDYLYSADAAEAFWRMAQKGKSGSTYPLGSGCSRPLREYIIQMRNAIDPVLPLEFGKIPYDSKQVMHLQADISALQYDTGFHPSTDFETGIRHTIDWIRSTSQ